MIVLMQIMTNYVDLVIGKRSNQTWNEKASKAYIPILERQSNSVKDSGGSVMRYEPNPKIGLRKNVTLWYGGENVFALVV